MMADYSFTLSNKSSKINLMFRLSGKKKKVGYEAAANSGTPAHEVKISVIESDIRCIVHMNVGLCGNT